MVSILSTLSSIDFPRSFPLGFAHLFFLNTVPNLVHHAVGNGKVPNTGEGYAVNASDWGKIGAELAKATSTVPAAFGRHFRNIAKEPGMMVAEDWLNFIVYASRPIFSTLYAQKQNQDYLCLWEILAEVVENCLLFRIPCDLILRIENGLLEFIPLYEK